MVAEGFDSIAGHDDEKRALQVAAAGGHAVLMTGSDNDVMRALAASVTSIMPVPTDAEREEAEGLWRLVGDELDVSRPTRAPHWSCTMAGLVGGGFKEICPGEVSLAHTGVLYLENVQELKPALLQAVRAAMERGKVDIVRADVRRTFPARFLLVASARPCPCGNFGSVEFECTCSATNVMRYRNRVLGPAADVVPMHVDVMPCSPDKETHRPTRTDEASLADGVARAWEFRAWRDGRFEDAADMADEAKLLAESMGSSFRNGRQLAGTVKVARTIADMEQSGRVDEDHFAEAAAYRQRFGWDA